MLPCTPEQMLTALRPVVAEIAADEPILIGQGWEHAVFALDGARVLRCTAAPTGYEDLARSCQLVGLLSGRIEGVHLPRCLAAPALHRDSGIAYAICERLHGEQPSPQRARGGGSALAESLGTFLRQLHAARIGPNAAEAWPQRCALFAQQCRESLWPLLPKRSAKLVEQRWERLQALLLTAKPTEVMAHGDLTLENLRVADDGTLRGVLDWDDALHADPAYDLRSAATFLSSAQLRLLLSRYDANVDNNFTERLAHYRALLPLEHAQHARAVGDPALLALALRELHSSLQAEPRLAML